MKSPKDSGLSSCRMTSGVQVANWIGNTYGWLSRVERRKDDIPKPVPRNPPTAKWIHFSGRESAFLWGDGV